MKHFRSLEERKKQHRECTYLSDTLPRKKTAPSVSPHFSSATLGRNIANKVRAAFQPPQEVCAGLQGRLGGTLSIMETPKFTHEVDFEMT